MKPKLFYFFLHLIPILLFISLLVWIVYAFSPQTLYSDSSPPRDRWVLNFNVISYSSNYGHLHICTEFVTQHCESVIIDKGTWKSQKAHLQTKRQERSLQTVQKEPTLLPTIEDRECKADKAADKITYAWKKWWDIDFILTVSAESMWDENAIWDRWLAYGFCQYRSDYNKWWQDKYREMKTWQERLEFCKWSYDTWIRNGTIRTKLTGYNVRHQNKLNINCQ